MLIAQPDFSFSNRFKETEFATGQNMTSYWCEFALMADRLNFVTAESFYECRIRGVLIITHFYAHKQFSRMPSVCNIFTVLVSSLRALITFKAMNWSGVEAISYCI